MWHIRIGADPTHLLNLFMKLLNLQNFQTYEFKKIKNKKEVQEQSGLELHQAPLSQSSFKPPKRPKGPKSRRLRKVLQSPQWCQWSFKLLPPLTPVITPFSFFWVFFPLFSSFPSSSLLLLNPFLFSSFLFLLLYCSRCHPIQEKQQQRGAPLLAVPPPLLFRQTAMTTKVTMMTIWEGVSNPPSWWIGADDD